MDLQAQLKALGLNLPEPAAPVATYVPAVRSGNLIYVSGQLPVVDGRLQSVGPVPSAVSVEGAREAAAQCALNALAIVDQQIRGDWATFRQVVRVGVFVLSDLGSTKQSAVADGASELLGKLFNEKGAHARVAVGVAALPLGATVELEMTVEIGSGEYSY